jgi:N-acetylglucosamine malate deacetylase 1
MTCDRKVLFLLAHQDDEVFVAPRILFELKRGTSPFLIYLTNGAATVQDVEVRDHESRIFLKQLGVSPAQVIFLGSEFQIPDGDLVARLELCFDLLLQKIRGQTFEEIYAPAWEGGHQDHDAAYLIGLALARTLALESQFWQFYCYNGFNTRGRFFQVLHPLPRSIERRERKFKLSEGLTVLKSILFFKSQKKTWLGLFPQTVIYLLFLRTEVFDRGTPEQATAPAHEGGLLYERWKRMSYSEFDTKARKFRKDFVTPRMPRDVAGSNKM